MDENNWIIIHKRGSVPKYRNALACILKGKAIPLLPAALILICCLLLTVHTGYATTENNGDPAPPIDTGSSTLSQNTPSRSAPQEEVLKTINVVCPQLAAKTSDELNAAEKDLLFRCGEVVRQETTNENDTLSAMTSEETDTMGTVSVEISGTQLAALTERLAALRQGTGSGALSLTVNRFPYGLALNGEPESETETQELNIPGGKLSTFINGSFATGDKDNTGNEPGFDFDHWGVTLGADLKMTSNLIIGAAFGYSRIEADLDLSAGDLDVDGYGLSLYGTWYRESLYIDLVTTYVNKEYESHRNVRYTTTTTTIDQTFKGDSDANEFGISLGGGYNFNFDALTLTPYAQVNYLDIEIDGYDEKLSSPNTSDGFGLGLSVEDQDLESLTSVLGFQVSRAISTKKGVLTPYFRFDWEHEYENEDRTIKASFINGTQATGNVINIPTDAPDRNFYNLSVGTSMVLPRGIMTFIDYQTVLGLEDITSHQFTGGLRYEF